MVDEYQMIGDPDRGLNYELAMALAPPRTQLLLLSGSVDNPAGRGEVAARLGRNAVLIRTSRPVPLEEVFVEQPQLSFALGDPRLLAALVAKALAEDLGPVLVFAPRRQAAEALAAELARQACRRPNPLRLDRRQKQFAGEHLAGLLKCRIAYHHSGLSYGARAGVVEPLAKAGQLRVVVATMGLAAGINFSLRSVALAGESYRRDYVEQPLRPDEILQMFGRAGRRGIDEIGYVLVSANEIRLRDGHPSHLSRSGLVDWSALLGIMAAAADQGRDPFAEAVRVQERLFTSKPIVLGVEESLKFPAAPCGLKTDAERARHVRKKIRQIRNSRGEWENQPPLGDRPWRTFSPGPRAAAAAGRPAPGFAPGPVRARGPGQVGPGTLVVLSEAAGVKTFGRAMTVADRLHDGRIVLAKWIRRLTHWSGRQATADAWDHQLAPLVAQRLAQQKTPVVRFEIGPQKSRPC